jgi:branched-chain amino acid aminotransferase
MSDNHHVRLICHNGIILPVAKASINVMSTTAQYGINVFEGVRCYLSDDRNQLLAFRLNEHLERLFNSARLLKFELNEEINHDFIKEQVVKIIQANGYREELYVKIGFYLDGDAGWSSCGPVSYYILPTPKGRVYADKVGLDCCVSSWMRINDLAISPRIKAGANYLNSRMAFMEAKTNGYDYGIFLNHQQKVAEGLGACIFIVRDKKIITPSKTSSILESITRDAIITIVRDRLAAEVEERDIDRTELYLAEEIFLVGTSVEILPVVSIDRMDVNSREIGKITKSLISLYAEAARGKNPEYNHWLTLIY